jgi:hypothetical protein
LYSYVLIPLLDNALKKLENIKAEVNNILTIRLHLNFGSFSNSYNSNNN